MNIKQIDRLEDHRYPSVRIEFVNESSGGKERQVAILNISHDDYSNSPFRAKMDLSEETDITDIEQQWNEAISSTEVQRTKAQGGEFMAEPIFQRKIKEIFEK
ncbi:MAG: hypothetical protein MI717_09650 [Spirochaetales bacterium]|nr:hypothetical protein [Spirochaetales bacterium]